MACFWCIPHVFQIRLAAVVIRLPIPSLLQSGVGGQKTLFPWKNNLKLCIKLVSFVNLFVSCLIWACKISCRKNIPVGVLPFFSFIKILNGQPFKKRRAA